MKKDMLRILRCPGCKKSGLDIIGDSVTEHPPQELSPVGKLKCHFCGAGYRIENGIVVFVEENAPGASRRSGTDY